MSKFVEIPAASLLATMTAICDKVEKAGGTCNRGTSGREITFDITPPDTPVFVRVFTSLGHGDDTVRDCGTDAVRIVVGADVDEKYRPLNKSRRIYRTAPQGEHEARVKAFLDRLTQALRDAYKQAATHPICRECERPFQLRENGKTKNRFWGCTGYPQCRRSFNYTESK